MLPVIVFKTCNEIFVSLNVLVVFFFCSVDRRNVVCFCVCVFKWKRVNKKEAMMMKKNLKSLASPLIDQLAIFLSFSFLSLSLVLTHTLSSFLNQQISSFFLSFFLKTLQETKKKTAKQKHTHTHTERSTQTPRF